MTPGHQDMRRMIPGKLASGVMANPTLPLFRLYTALINLSRGISIQPRGFYVLKHGVPYRNRTRSGRTRARLGRVQLAHYKLSQLGEHTAVIMIQGTILAPCAMHRSCQPPVPASRLLCHGCVVAALRIPRLHKVKCPNKPLNVIASESRRRQGLILSLEPLLYKPFAPTVHLPVCSIHLGNDHLS
jgi:hypothetical protein